MMVSGKLYPHLNEIEQTMNRRLEQMMPELMQAAGVWDSMSDAEKVVTILGAVTAAAFAAALAVGAFQSALSLGVAVVAITPELPP